MKKHMKNKMYVLGAAVLFVLTATVSIVTAEPQTDLRREDVWPFYPPPYVIGSFYSPRFGLLMEVDLDGDGDADYYVDRWGNILADLDCDGDIDYCLERDGDIVMGDDEDAQEPCVYEGDHGWHGVDVTGNGIPDAWNHIFFYGVRMDIDHDGDFDCLAGCLKTSYGHPLRAQ